MLDPLNEIPEAKATRNNNFDFIPATAECLNKQDAKNDDELLELWSEEECTAIPHFSKAGEFIFCKEMK